MSAKKTETLKLEKSSLVKKRFGNSSEDKVILSFAAAFAICGGANPKIARKLRRPAWRIDHGEADEVVPVELSKKMVSAILKKRGSVTYNWYPGVNHNSWDNVFADSEFLPWLFAQKK